jgi:hypothetical protein
VISDDDVTVAFKVRDEVVSCRVLPSGGKVVGNAPLAASGCYKAQFLHQPEDRKEFMPVMQKSWWFDAKCKNLGFIIQSGGRLPGIFTFRDLRDPEGRPSDGDPEIPLVVASRLRKSHVGHVACHITPGMAQIRVR